MSRNHPTGKGPSTHWLDDPRLFNQHFGPVFVADEWENMVSILLRIWGERSPHCMPVLTVDDAGRLIGIAENIMLVEILQNGADFIYCAVGAETRRLNGRSLVGMTLSELIARNLEMVEHPGIQGDILGTFSNVTRYRRPAYMRSHMEMLIGGTYQVRKFFIPVSDLEPHFSPTHLLGISAYQLIRPN